MTVNKARIEEFARERFFGSRLFSPARTAYQFLFNRQKFSNRRHMLRFYSQLIRRDDLVFDVGANVGVYTEVFAALGAKVIAVEPNPRCCRVLQQLAQRLPVQVRQCAVADAPGKLTLQVCENHLLSALAPTVADAAERSPLHREAHWTDSIEVEVKTLDQLATVFGVPQFIKVDAEGVDDRVLRGMSFRPRIVSFEYYRHLPDVALRCMDTPVFASGYEFNYVQGVDMQFASKNWLPLGEFRAQLESLARGGEDYGDVIARSLESAPAKPVRNGASSGSR
jgi:FkbM family methyltransferase